MASTVLDPIADALVAKVNALTPSVTGYLWDPRSLSPPAGVVGVPSVSRTGIEEPESQLGRDDWSLTFPVTFYVDLADAAYAQALIVEIAEAWILALDADRTLASVVHEARVTEAGPAEAVEDVNARALLAFPTEVEVLQLV